MQRGRPARMPLALGVLVIVAAIILLLWLAMVAYRP